jgi:hypothetical protein
MFFRNIVYAPFPEGSLAGCTKMGVPGGVSVAL